MMILWTPAQRRNPILNAARLLNRRDFDYPAALFDHANGQAWMKAGEPDDRPGSEWWDWENEAQRFIERWWRP